MTRRHSLPFLPSHRWFSGGPPGAAIPLLLAILFLGSGACRDGTERLPSPSWTLHRVLEVAGRQGVATDGRRLWVSGSTALYLHTPDGTLLAANETPFEGLATPANHIGDISVHAGRLYAGIEHFRDGRATGIRVAVYDAETLQYLDSIAWDPASGQVEVSGVAVDPASGTIWMTDWVDGSHVYRYDLATGSYAGRLRLDPAPRSQQGIAVRDGFLYITADDGDADRNEPDTLWSAPADLRASTVEAVPLRTFPEFRRAGEIEGLDFDPLTGGLLVLSNRGRRIVLGMPKGLYPGYDREIHEVYVFVPAPE